MVFTRKYSEFPQKDSLDESVGLESGENSRGPGGGAGEVNPITVYQPGHNLDRGYWVKFDGVDYIEAIANTPENGEVIGVVSEYIDEDYFKLQQSGYIPNLHAQNGPDKPYVATIVSGQSYFLSETATGEIDTVDPTTNNSVSAPCLLATSDQGGWIYCLKRGKINGNAAGGSGSGSGDCCEIVVSQSGHGFMVGQWVYVSAPDTFALAIATELTSALAVGMVTEVNVDGDANKFRLQMSGYTDVLSGLAVAPNYYFLSESTPGLMVTTEPTSPASYSKPLFINLNSGAGFILEQRLHRVAEGPNFLYVNQPLHGFAPGDFLYPDTATTFAKAIATSYATSLTVGAVIWNDTNNFIIQQSGYTDKITSPTAAREYYLSASLAGTKTLVEPTTTGQISRPIFMSTSTTEGFILEQRPLIQPYSGFGGGWNKVFDYDITNDTNIAMDGLLENIDTAVLVLENLVPTLATPVALQFGTGTGAGPFVYSAANYRYTNMQNLVTGGGLIGINNTGLATFAYMDITPWDSGAGSMYINFSGHVWMYGLSDTGAFDNKRLTWETNTRGGGTGYEKISHAGGAWLDPTTAVTSIRVFAPFGLWSTGRVKLYTLS